MGSRFIVKNKRNLSHTHENLQNLMEHNTIFVYYAECIELRVVNYIMLSRAYKLLLSFIAEFCPYDDAGRHKKSNQYIGHQDLGCNPLLYTVVKVLCLFYTCVYRYIYINMLSDSLAFYFSPSLLITHCVRGILGLC